MATERVQLVRETSIEVTVGSGGDFATINAAIESLTRRSRIHTAAGWEAVITLQSGFVMEEQVMIDGLNLGWIKIEAVDAVTTISRAALTTTVASYQPAFGVIRGQLPTIRCLFNMDTSGVPAEQSGIQVRPGGIAYIDTGCGITNATARGLHCIEARVWAEGSIWDGAGNVGARIGNMSHASLRNASFVGCATGIAASGGSSVSAQMCDFDGCATGVRCEHGSTVYMGGSTALACTEAAIYASDGGHIDAHDVDASGSLMDGVRCYYGSSVNFARGLAPNAGRYGIHAIESSTVNADLADVSGAATAGLYALTGSFVNFNNGDASGGGSSDIALFRGAVVAAVGAAGSISPPGATNRVVSDGVVFSHTTPESIKLSYTSAAPATGTYHDYVVGSSLLRLAPTGNITITGIERTLAGDTTPIGREITIVNQSAFTVTLAHENTGSSALNRFQLPGAANIVIPGSTAVKLVWANNRWFCVGGIV